MSSIGLLTSDDLDELGHSVFDVEDPLTVVAGLVAAVDEDRLAEVADTSYALALAAEIAERHGDLEKAVGLAGRGCAGQSSAWAAGLWLSAGAAR